MLEAWRVPMVLAGIALLLALVPTASMAGDWQRAAPQFQIKGCSMAVFADPDFKGPSFKTSNGWAAVGWEFDSKISSIKVHAGIWQLFKDDNFNSQIETLFPGDYAHLRPTTDNKIRSFRCVRAT